jgi:glycosyltransferase involved in cell wall biosynthesis
MRLAYYSTIPCEPTFGGPLQIHRHFRERDDFVFMDLNAPEQEPWDGWIPGWVARHPIFLRLCRTRLYPWFIYWSNHGNLRKQGRRLGKEIMVLKADALVTVAYGRRCHVCRIAAKMAKVPLVTFFHDWWPDLVMCKTPKTLALMDRQFRSLARESTLVLAVSQPLLDELGGPSRALVLPPIPSVVSFRLSVEATPRREPRILVYAGTLQGPYGKMVRELGFALLESDNHPWELRAYGPAGDWPADERRILEEAAIYQGYQSNLSERQKVMAKADAFLCVMNFDAADERRVRTSFPSKLLDYLPYRKPILVWGPEKCAATEWASTHRLGPVFTNADATGVSRSLNGEELSVNLWKGWRKNCAALAEALTADSIHTSLVNAFKGELPTK